MYNKILTETYEVCEFNNGDVIKVRRQSGAHGLALWQAWREVEDGSNTMLMVKHYCSTKVFTEETALDFIGAKMLVDSVSCKVV